MLFIYSRVTTFLAPVPSLWGRMAIDQHWEPCVGAAVSRNSSQISHIPQTVHCISQLSCVSHVFAICPSVHDPLILTWIHEIIYMFTVCALSLSDIFFHCGCLFIAILLIITMRLLLSARHNSEGLHDKTACNQQSSLQQELSRFFSFYIYIYIYCLSSCLIFSLSFVPYSHIFILMVHLIR